MIVNNKYVVPFRTLADDLCDQMIGADEELSTLFSRFPSVDFERKAPEAGKYDKVDNCALSDK